MSYLLAYNPYNTNLFMRSRSIDPAALAYFNATGISGSIEQQAINTLVEGLKADGLWSKMKAVYPFVTDNRNLLGYTEDLDTWTVQSIVKTLNYATAPDGTNTAIRIQGTANNWYIGITLPVTTISNKIFSVYVKSNTGLNQNFKLFYDNTNASPDYTATTSWQLFTFTVNSATGSGISGFSRDSLNNTADLLFWHPQVEQGTVATTYQPIATTQQAFISSQFKYNLVNPVDSDAAFRLVFNGGWTHSSNGATPNGTNGYADTKLNDSVLTPNSSHMSYYSRTNIITNTYEMGIYNGTKGIWFALAQASGSVFSGGIFQAGTSGEVSVSNTNSTGYYIGGKNGSTTVKFYKNGASVASATKTDTTATNTNIYLATLNQNGTPAFGFSTKQCAFSTIGDGLTDTEAANLYTRVQACQTALSRQV